MAQIRRNINMTATVTIGTVSGYNHDNFKAWSLNAFTTWLQEFMEEYEYDGNRYISWLVLPAKTVYKKEWGSPIGGEDVFVIQASHTLRYDGDISLDLWAKNVEKCAKCMKERLKQSTVRIQYTESIVRVL